MAAWTQLTWVFIKSTEPLYRGLNERVACGSGAAG